MPPPEETQQRREQAVAAARSAFRTWVGEQLEKNRKLGIKTRDWAVSIVGTSQPNPGRWMTGMEPGLDTLVLLSLASGDSISRIVGESEPALTGMALVAAVSQASPELQRIIWEGLDPKFGPARNEELAAAIARTAPATPLPPPSAPDKGILTSPRKRHRKG